MKILLPVDGSKFTKKALAFLVNNDVMANGQAELVALHVQAPVPPRVKAMLGAATVADYHRDEARKVLGPIERFLERHDVSFKSRWVIGSPAAEVVRASKAEKAQLIVMGTHGHGMLGRALMGSVAQNVVRDSDVPVLLVK